MSNAYATRRHEARIQTTCFERVNVRAGVFYYKNKTIKIDGFFVRKSCIELSIHENFRFGPNVRLRLLHNINARPR